MLMENSKDNLHKIYFTTENSSEEFTFSLEDISIVDYDIVLTTMHDQTKNLNYLVFSINDFAKFSECWNNLISLSKDIDLSKEIEYIRLIVIYSDPDLNKKITEYYLLQPIRLNKNENECVIYYKYIGQLIENYVYDKLLEHYTSEQYLKSSNSVIEEGINFLKESEEKMYRKKLINGTDLKLTVFTINKKGELIFDRKKAVSAILGFKEIVKVFEGFHFKMLPLDKTNLNMIIKIPMNTAIEMNEAFKNINIEISSFN